jgi:hypothetical protein
LFRNIQCQDKCKKKEEKEKWRTQKRWTWSKGGKKQWWGPENCKLL